MESRARNVKFLVFASPHTHNIEIIGSKAQNVILPKTNDDSPINLLTTQQTIADPPVDTYSTPQTEQFDFNWEDLSDSSQNDYFDSSLFQPEF